MSDWLLQVYHRLPSPLRSLVASAWGYVLRRSRYGRETERVVAAALERDQWSAEHWRTWQEQRLTETLVHAAQHVPYYRRYWDEQRRLGIRADIEDLSQWPILTKADLRRGTQEFLAEGISRRSLHEETTSGTTGTPVTMWHDRQALVAWYGLSEARWRRWYGVSLRDRWAILGGKRVVPFEQTRPPFWVWNAGLNQLYLSSLHARGDFLPHYLRALADHRITYLYGYSSSLYWLALAALEQRASGQAPPLPRLKVVLTNAEPLYDYQRAAIEQAFECPVRETYGQSEKLAAASQCEHGRLHFWPDAGRLELVDEFGQPTPRGQTGRLVCTGLLNRAMPLIRYDLQDQAVLPAREAACPCGRSLPQVERIVGRSDDVILTRDGRRLALVDIVFGPELQVREAQLIQESLDVLRVKLVPDAGWSAASEQLLRRSLRERVGDMEVIVEQVNEIPRTWAGKFRMLISHVQTAETALRAAQAAGNESDESPGEPCSAAAATSGGKR